MYAEADGCASVAPASELEELGWSCERALAAGAPLPATGELLHNDLQRAAISLCPQIADVLALAEARGRPALVSGSGPTVLALSAARDLLT